MRSAINKLMIVLTLLLVVGFDCRVSANDKKHLVYAHGHVTDIGKDSITLIYQHHDTTVSVTVFVVDSTKLEYQHHHKNVMLTDFQVGDRVEFWFNRTSMDAYRIEGHHHD